MLRTFALDLSAGSRGSSDPMPPKVRRPKCPDVDVGKLHDNIKRHCKTAWLVEAGTTNVLFRYGFSPRAAADPELLSTYGGLLSALRHEFPGVPPSRTLLGKALQIIDQAEDHKLSGHRGTSLQWSLGEGQKLRTMWVHFRESLRRSQGSRRKDWDAAACNCLEQSVLLLRGSCL